MPERNYERFLRGVLSRSIGADVEQVDDGSRNGMHDAEVRYPDGRIAAVEFTSIGERAAFQMQSLPTELLIPSTPFWWTLRYELSGVLWRDVERHVPVLVAVLDQYGMRDADDLRREFRGLPAWDWYERNDLSLRHFGPVSKGGRVDVLPKASGGVVDSDYLGLNAWVESMQAEPWWGENVAKLARSGRSELHLALRAHDTGVPFSLLAALMDGGPISVGDPSGMDPVTDLWIVIPYGTSAAHWSAREGWAVHNYATPEEDATTTANNAESLRRIIDGAMRALDGHA